MYIFPDLILHNFFRQRLNQLKEDKALVDQMLSLLKDSQFEGVYGQEEIDQFKAFLDKKISIVNSFNLISLNLPNISLLEVSTGEDQSKSVIGDLEGRTFDGVTSQDRLTFAVNSNIQIGIHAESVTAARWLHSLIIYWIINNKKILSNRGLSLVSWSSSDFNRMNEFLPENIFSKFITTSSLSYIRTDIVDDQALATEVDVTINEDQSLADLVLGHNDKSLQTDYESFKRRYKQANLGTLLEARNDFDYIRGTNKYLKKKALDKLKQAGVKIKDIPSLKL